MSSICTRLRSRPALPNSRDESKRSRPMPAIVVGHGDLERERVAGRQRARRSRRRADRRRRRAFDRTCAPATQDRGWAACANRSPTAPAPPAIGAAVVAVLRSTGRNVAGVARRDRRDAVRRGPRRRVGVFHLDRCRPEGATSAASPGGVESNTAHATPGRGERVGGGANEDGAAGRRIEIGEETAPRAARPPAAARCSRSELERSASPNVMLPSEFTNAADCGTP